MAEMTKRYPLHHEDAQPMYVNVLREEYEELKAEIKRKEAVGQRWFERCMAERTENRRLRRALWLARAERAKAMYTYWHVKCIEGHLLYEHKWIVVERLCRAKAEEYK